MNKYDYQQIEAYMLENVVDSAHDKEHIFRVLYAALDIAACEDGVDYDVLIAACLLHDIGRQEEFENPVLCHAAVGAEKACGFLIQNGFPKEFADRVSACIKTHRYRAENPPETIEAKILYDSDKLDVSGTLGIARTIAYKSQFGDPLYTFDKAGEISDGSEDTEPSFFKEYKYKLEGLYTKFYTKRGRQLALLRRDSAVAFYESMLKEVKETYGAGRDILSKQLK